MIYFFHRREDIKRELSNRTFLEWYEDKMKEAAGREDYREIYRLLYDMADYIYDKRFDQGAGDEELNRFVEDHTTDCRQNTENDTSDTTDRNSAETAVKHHRIDGLKKILRIADEWLPSPIMSGEDDRQMVLYYLAKGVICLRISQCYMNSYDYAYSDLYGKEAQELLWHGKQIISRIIAEEHQKGIYSDESELYIRVLKLHIAKFHRNYAKKNRRSDYDAAMDEYRHLCSKIQNRHHINEVRISSIWTPEEEASLSPEQKHEKNREWFLGLSEPLRRQFALLWLDSIADIAFIHRSRNQIELAHKETIFTYFKLREILLRGAQPDEWNAYRRSDSEFWKNADRLISLDRMYWRQACRSAAADEVPSVDGTAAESADSQNPQRDNGNACNVPAWFDEGCPLSVLEAELTAEFDYSDLNLDFNLYIERGLSQDASNGNNVPVCSAYAYDVRRFFLLTLNELAMIRCDLHRAGYYTSAAVTAVLGDLWSYDMDGPFPDDNMHHSIDAVNYLSIAMRKYFKFRYGNEQAQTRLCENLQFAFGHYADADRQAENAGMFSETSSFRQFHEASEETEDDRNLIWIRRVLSLLYTYADGNYLSRSEILKWYCLALELRDSFGHRICSMIDFQKNIVGNFPEITRHVSENDNIQSLFLCGMLFLRLHAYSKAIRYFNQVLSHTEADYIRVRSLGNKTQYLKASCLISLGRYKQAEEILLELRNKLKFAFQSKAAVPDAPPAPDWYQDQDERVESSLGFCYIQRGNYSEAGKIFDRMYFRDPYDGQKTGERSGEGIIGIGEKDSKDNGNTGTPGIYRNRRMKPRRQIWQWNNLAACCIFLGEKMYRDKDYTPETLFDRAERIKGSKDRETQLLRGYYTIVRSGPESREERLRRALEYFACACDLERGFASQMELMPEHFRKYRIRIDRNETQHRQEVESFSAYIITLIDLCYLTSRSIPSGQTFEANADIVRIKRILLSLPESMELSMKAAIAVAEWLVYYKRKAMPGKKTLVSQLFRSFSYLRIFEERGARVFNELKEDRTFRFFGPEQRGEILARLLILYQPVKVIKEASSFTLEDRTEDIHLCHYASMETLKMLLSREEARRETHLHASNCGYMNDVFEGNTFLSKIRQMYNNPEFRRRLEKDKKNDGSAEDSINNNTAYIKGHHKKKWNEFMQQYYPQQKRSSDYMIPSASDVYVACLSVHRDSFPLWTIYGDEEHGCNIEFGDDFFDIAGPVFYPEGLRKYIMSRYTDDDFPLYKVSYLRPDDGMSVPDAAREDMDRAADRWSEGMSGRAYDDVSEGMPGGPDETLPEAAAASEERAQAGMNEWEILTRDQMYEQGCGTKVLGTAGLNRCIANLTGKWIEFDQFLDSLYNFNSTDMMESMNTQGIKDPREAIRSFAAHRLDEIRFLFKDWDYIYEAEVRTVYTVSSMADARTKAQIDLNQDTPRVYIDIDRDLNNLTVTLGSRIDDRTVDKYVTWLKQTRRVNCVRLAKRNRYASASKQ